MVKLTIASIILALAFQGITKAQNTMQDKSIKNEFYKNENLETLYKGKFAGTLTQNETEYFHFQFDGVLKGNKRFLNIYFETNKDKEKEKTTFFNETNTATEGSIAYLLFKLGDQSSSDLSYKLQNNQFANSGNNNRYDFSKLPPLPDKFFEYANAETEPRTDTVFVVSMVGNQHSEFFTIELIAWIKNSEGAYYPERYKTFVDGNNELVHINIKGQ